MTVVFTIGRFINLMHTTLFLPVIGRYVVNVFGVLMLISIVAGWIVSCRVRWSDAVATAAGQSSVGLTTSSIHCGDSFEFTS